MQVIENTQLQRLAPSVFATAPYAEVSKRYAFIPTIRVLDAMRDAGFFPVEARQSMCRIDGKAEFAKHMVKFMRAQDIEAMNAHKAARPGQHHFFERHGEIAPEFPQIALVNSHDATSGYQLLAGLLRLACSNGLLISSSTLDSIRVRHTGNVVDNVIEGSFKIIKQMPRVAEQVQEMKAITLDRAEQHAFAAAAMHLRYETNEQGAVVAPFEPDRLLGVRRHEDAPPTLWNTLNVVQENFVKGGVRGRSATGRRTSTRAITSVGEDIKLNKALWSLAESLKALKS